MPDQSQAHYYLALAFEADRKPAEALRAAQQAMRLAPDDPGARGLTQRLALAVAAPGTAKPIANPVLVPATRSRSQEEPIAEPAR